MILYRLENDTAAGSFKNIVDSIGLAMHSLDITEGIHRCLMAAIGGDQVNVFWIADNSVPVSNKVKDEAQSCLQSIDSLDCLYNSDSLKIMVRRVLQIYGTVISDDLAKEDPRSNFVKPLLARPLLETVVLVLSMYRTRLEKVSNSDLRLDNIHSVLRVNSNPTHEIAAALADAYLDGELKGESLHAQDYDNSSASNHFFHVIRWIVMGRLVQIVLLSSCKRISMNLSSSSNTHESKRPDYSELPMHGLLVELENIILEVVFGVAIDSSLKIPNDCYLDDNDLNRILTDWMQFIRSVLHLLTRCHKIDELSFWQFQLDKLPREFAISKLSEAEVVLTLNSIGLSSLLTRTPLAESLILVARKWIGALLGFPDSSKDLRESSSCLSTVHIATVFKECIESSAQLGQFIVSNRSWYENLTTHPFLEYSHANWKKYRGFDVDTCVDSSIVADNLKAICGRLGIVTVKNIGKAARNANICIHPTDLSRKLEIFHFPESYTEFHQRVGSLCAFEYPAICLTCGLILNAGIALARSFLLKITNAIII